MFCPECGTKIEDSSARFCPSCGHAIGAAEPSHPAAHPAAPAQSAAVNSVPPVQPRRRMSGCAIAAIVGGIVLILGLIGIAGLFLIVGAATSPAVDALENHFALLANGQDQAAYEQTTSDFFKTQTSPAQYQEFLKANPALRQISHIGFSNRQVENNNALLEGSITVNDVKTAFQAALIKESGSWKINGLVFGDDAKQ